MSEKKVLYAEDEYTNRFTVELYFKRNNIIIDTVEDGEEAVMKCKTGNYDLVLLDQYMPKMNGDLAAREIKKLFPNLPLIAITSDDSNNSELMEAGFLEILIKPVKAEEYSEIIKRYLLDA